MNQSSSKKKIAIFVCHDFFGLELLNMIVPEIYKLDCEPIVFNTTINLNRKFKNTAPSDVYFYNVKMLNDVLLPYLDSKPLFEVHNGSYFSEDSMLSFLHLRDFYNLEYHEIVDVNSSKTFRILQGDDSIIGGISLRFLQIFEDRIINFFRQRGFLWNLHSGLLPEYKGLLIPFRAINNGEKSFGFTLHEIAQGIDTGDILDISSTELTPSKSVFEIYRENICPAVKMIIQVLRKYFSDGLLVAMPQKEMSSISYYPYPTDLELATFKEKGIYYIKSPKYVLDLFSSKFYLSNQAMQFDFSQKIVNAISDWEHSKAVDVFSSTSHMAEKKSA